MVIRFSAAEKAKNCIVKLLLKTSKTIFMVQSTTAIDIASLYISVTYRVHN